MPDLTLTPAGRENPRPASRSRRRRGRALRILGIAMVAVGALALADAAATLLWQEPVSALIASLRQDSLAGDLRHAEAARPGPAEQRALASISEESTRIAYLARHMEHAAAPGSAVGRISIPRIGASFVVVAGTGEEELQGGPGIYPQTNFPGVPGTTAIAGHRTTFLAPFRHIDELRSGDSITVTMPYGRFTYRVLGQRVVEPTDFRAAVAEVGYSRLVLSACTPLFSAAKRLLVYARLVRTVPRGSALKLPGGALPRTIEPAAHPAARPLPGVLPSGYLGRGSAGV